MRGQVWYIAALIAVMCAVRFSLAAYGYATPGELMEQLRAPIANNPQMPYIVRVWAIRDIVLAVLVVIATPATVRKLLVACIIIDLTDVLSAHLSGLSGMFNSSDVWSLKATAIAALIPEILALILISIKTRAENA
jgi:hypothetical protein